MFLLVFAIIQLDGGYESRLDFAADDGSGWVRVGIVTAYALVMLVALGEQWRAVPA